MELSAIGKYLRSMSLSIVMMLLLTYGMATNNPFLQPLYIIITVLALQFGYQIIKSIRSKDRIDVNMREAIRAKKGVILFEASESSVNKAKGKYSGEMALGTKMLIMLFTPLIIFITSGYVLSILVPGIQNWQSYMIGFLLSMPVSTFLSFKMKAVPGAMAVTPSSFIVSEKGIAFDNMGQSFILRFPLLKLKVQRENNFIEVEGKSEASVIPSKLRLFSDKINQLEKVLSKNLLAT